MKNQSNQMKDLTPLQRSFLLIEQLQKKLDKFQNFQTEPIAIIGMGCRFPKNVKTPKEFWNLLSEGVDAITEVPSTRWNINDYYDPD
ncbi:MAG: beta-ketoacyl synthase, partial [Okeania sp. SIO4D6]|nr:beta-ketoacyl synthase [Okeania sp. SIO4D6]